MIIWRKIKFLDGLRVLQKALKREALQDADADSGLMGSGDELVRMVGVMNQLTPAAGGVGALREDGAAGGVSGRNGARCRGRRCARLSSSSSQSWAMVTRKSGWSGCCAF